MALLLDQLSDLKEEATFQHWGQKKIVDLAGRLLDLASEPHSRMNIYLSVETNF